MQTKIIPPIASTLCHHEKIPYQDRNITILVLSGTPYEMGKMLGHTIGKGLSEGLATSVPSLVRKIGLSLKRKRTEFISELEDALRDFTPLFPNDLLEEIKGIYAGCQEAGYPIKDPVAIVKLLIAIELGERECTMFALRPEEGPAFHLGNLDYYTKINMSYNPLITIRIPQTEDGRLKGNPVAIFNYIDTYPSGATSAINGCGVVISQIRGKFREKINSIGMPLLCKIPFVLNQSENIQQACEMVKKIPGATDHYMMLSDPSKVNLSMQMILTGNNLHEKVSNNYDCDLSIFNLASENYQPLENIIYWTDNCVKYRNGNQFTLTNQEFCELLKPHKKKFNGDIGVEIAKNVTNDTTLISTLFCNDTKEVWVSFGDFKIPSHQCPYLRIDLNKYFSMRNNLNLLNS